MVVFAQPPAIFQTRNAVGVEPQSVRRNSSSHIAHVLRGAGRVCSSGDQIGGLAHLVFGHRPATEVRAVGEDIGTAEVECAVPDSGVILQLVRPQVGDHRFVDDVSHNDVY